MDEFEIITPPTANERDPLDHGLVALTEAIAQINPDMVSHGILGGQYGYGACYENDVFMMHSFCWCERPECLWCAIWLSNEIECSEEDAVAHRDKQTLEIREKYGEWAAAHPAAPHFWHKPTGFQVRWYKWIGRDMESNGVKVDLQAVFAECLNSLTAT